MNATATPSITAGSLNKLLSPTEQKHAEATKQAEKWVAQTFFGTMLKQMRNSPFKNEMFDGGRGGEAFHEMFDQQLADHMSRGAGTKLVNSIVKKIEGTAAYAKNSKLMKSKAKLEAGKVAAISTGSSSGGFARGGK